jgi:phospholipid/cholesterol/gamma-HCH transport system substrate-binding protein
MIQRKYETLVGLFAVSSLAAMLFMVLIIAQQERLWEEHVKYHAVFKNISGLKEGSEVRLAGMTVGKVMEFTIDPQGQIIVAFEVLGKYSSRVRQDSQASIEFISLLGEKNLELTAGSLDQPTISPEGYVASVEPLKITQLLAKAGPTLENLQKILDNGATLTGSLVGKEGGLNKTLDELQEIMKKINTGQGSLVLFVKDPKLNQETTKPSPPPTKFLPK